ncbi:hypothetical protein J1TS3_23600 [Siminovitchia fordii]|uniref:Uncharacterized protein n=1 Tax=Siminovitchia fordii TaxID=254759 RepID=A0ABQ4K669_9BACI|nr:hypothetical protein J1TS3_23600 [Siminovitchia fordii]
MARRENEEYRISINIFANGFLDYYNSYVYTLIWSIYNEREELNGSNQTIKVIKVLKFYRGKRE